jgi:hypothetical protein
MITHQIALYHVFTTLAPSGVPHAGLTGRKERRFVMASIADFRNDIADFIRGKPRVTPRTSKAFKEFVRDIDARSPEPPAKLVELMRAAARRHAR